MMLRSLSESVSPDSAVCNDDREVHARLQDRAKSFASVGCDSLYSLMVFIKELFATESGIEPVFIFDNVDHLDGESVCQISHFTRALFLEMRNCIVLAMRPPAYMTNVEADAHRGAFYTFRIMLPPPDLAAIFARRLSRIVKAGPFESTVDGTVVRIVIDDPRKTVTNIVDNVLTAENKRPLLGAYVTIMFEKHLLHFRIFCAGPDSDPTL